MKRSEINREIKKAEAFFASFLTWFAAIDCIYAFYCFRCSIILNRCSSTA